MPHSCRKWIPKVSVLAMMLLLAFAAFTVQARESDYTFHDAHFHLTNYVQEGTDVRDYLAIMGDTVGRSTLFGIPLQQTWSYQNTGDYAPTYYLHSDAPLYYYSFTDAYIAQVYNSLGADEQSRFDPMITGFNPADMYAVDHIRRVLMTFPGVFTGIGEFSIHKEFVSSKVAGNVASLTNPALDRILEFAGEAGLAVIIHCDIDVPFQSAGKTPTYSRNIRELAKRHTNVTLIWAHIGLGRVIFPPSMNSGGAPTAERSPLYLVMLENALQDPALNHVHYDISWDELAKFIVHDPDTINEMARIINRYPDRFLFGTDVMAPRSEEHYFGVYLKYEPLWNALTPAARNLVLKANYERIFDSAIKKVRAWEAAHLSNEGAR